MTVAENAVEFAGYPVEDYDPKKGIMRPQSAAYRLRLDYDESEAGESIVDRFDQLLADPAAPLLEALVIGSWTFEPDHSSEEIVEAIAAARDRLSKLWAIFIGDITFEEWEISWIDHSDVSPIFEAYPGLEHFRVRGGNGLSLGTLDHEHLKLLAVETGGMDAEIVRQVASARLPNLE